jgi:SAM-dependent methyltransferase
MSPDYEIARQYWSQPAAGPIEIQGVAALGGGGLAEVLFRQHDEVRRFTALVPLTKQTSLLELGCGNGRWILALAGRVGSYEAVDFSATMLAVARDRARGANLTNVNFVEAAAQDYVPGRTFDVIYLSGVTQYLHDADLAPLLARLAGRLAPGGVIIDRSTIHRRTRGVAAQAGYFSIYRTAAELIALYTAAGLALRRQTPSYRFLNFGRLGQRLLNLRALTRLIAATSPIAFPLLRAAAALRSAVAAPTGELVDYSHDFFLFQRETSP